jgi:hypothetical protein
MAETTRTAPKRQNRGANRLTSPEARGTLEASWVGWLGEWQAMAGRVSTYVQAGLLAGAMLAGMTVPGDSAGFFEKNFYMSGPRYTADVPLCTDSWPLSKIRSTFRTKEGRFWNSDLEIVDFQNVRETAFRPWDAGTIPRRFCRAEVIISDGAKRPLFFSIVEDGGFITMTFGVEWCVVGLDRDWAYNPACKMARP